MLSLTVRILKGRIDILKVHDEERKVDDTVDFEAIALATSGALVLTLPIWLMRRYPGC